MSTLATPLSDTSLIAPLALMADVSTANNLDRQHIDSILEIAERGWKLFPCGERDKKPLIKGWPRLASSDTSTILGWVAKHPGCNWGVTTGPNSGVWVLDVDGEDGRKSLAALEAAYGALPQTLASATGRAEGGEHRWFRCSTFQLKTSTGRLGDGLDVRGSGGFVIVPPSTHPSGNAYRWIDPLQTTAEAPEWLMRMVTTPRPQGIPSVQAVDVIEDGTRNATLCSHAGRLRRRGYELAAIEKALLEANERNCQLPLEQAEVLKVAASVMRYEPGGPDPLDRAWEAIQTRSYLSGYKQLMALACQLQLNRPEQVIALPLERIGELMGVHFTTVSKHRIRAVKEGLLKPVGHYIPHKRAGEYTVADKLMEEYSKQCSNLPS